MTHLARYISFAQKEFISGTEIAWKRCSRKGKGKGLLGVGELGSEGAGAAVGGEPVSHVRRGEQGKCTSHQPVRIL